MKRKNEIKMSPYFMKVKNGKIIRKSKKLKQSLAITLITATVTIGMSTLDKSVVFASDQEVSVNVTTPAAVSLAANEIIYESETDARNAGFILTLINNNTEYEIGGLVNTATSGDIIIPSKIAGKSVTSIGKSAFNSYNNLDSITIPSSVKSIGMYAFYGCSKLESMTIPDSVISIGDGIVCNCSNLKSIIIPNSITHIGNYTFQNCSSLELINMPSSLTSIGEHIFYGCSSLESITMPNGLTDISPGTFWGCSNLKLITMSSNVTSIGDAAFYDCSNLESITIPNSVTNIGNHAFGGCSNLKSITIPSKVTSILNDTFYGCSRLESITMPSSVTSLGNEAFYGCNSLNSINIPSNVTSLGISLFYKCSSLKSINIPSSVTSIEINAFNGCSSLESIIMPSSVTSIGINAFANINNNAVFYVNINQENDLVKNGGVVTGNHKVITYPLKLTFDSNGGSAINSIENVQPMDAITLPKAPTKEEYTFAGWYTYDTYSTEFDGSEGITADTTVYAKWTNKDKLVIDSNKYKLVFDSNGGSAVTSIENVQRTEAITLPEAPTKEGYTFAGWYTDNTYSTEFDESAGITENTIVYAKWTAKQSNSSNRSSSSRNKRSKISDVVYSKEDETSILNAINAKYSKIIVVNMDNNSASNNSIATIDNTPLITKNILEALIANTDKTLIIKTGDSSVEIKSIKEGQMQFTQNGTVITGVKSVANSDYCLNDSGIMQKGWLQVLGGNWYHFNNNTGVKDTNWLQDANNAWYYLDKTSGVMRTGWIKDGYGWYYLDKTSGVMKTGWIKDDYGWYYLYNDGSLAVNTIIDWYTIDENGRCI